MELSSEQYGWNDVNVVVGGRSLFGLRGVNVEFGYEHEEIRASGAKAHSINEKNFSVSGSIKVLQSEFEAFVESFGAKYQKQYFDIVWNFSPKGSIDINTHMIKNCKFGKSKMELNQGDAMMEIELPFMALDIEMNKK